MSVEFTLQGSDIVDIPSLYAELNRVFMADEDWALGNSLDALDDLLYGGYGALQGQQAVTVVWQDMETSRAALGVAATTAWLQHKLDQPGTFNTAPCRHSCSRCSRATGRPTSTSCWRSSPATRTSACSRHDRGNTPCATDFPHEHRCGMLQATSQEEHTP